MYSYMPDGRGKLRVKGHDGGLRSGDQAHTQTG